SARGQSPIRNRAAFCRSRGPRSREPPRKPELLLRFYQRVLRRPLPPPCGAPPRGRFPPPPNPPSVFGRASLTFIARPLSSAPFRLAIAFSASFRFVISTNPKPRGCPVIRSVGKLTRSTLPYWENAA